MTDETPTPILPVKQGAAIGGWVCFVLGAVIMYASVWTFIFYVPLFFAAFVLSIVAMSQRRIVLGILLLLTVIILPFIEWLVLATTRTSQFLDKQGVPQLAVISSPETPKASTTASKPEGIDRSSEIARAERKATPAPTPDPVERIYSDDLGKVDASQIVVALTRPLPVNPVGPAPVFSPDGKKLLCGVQPLNDRGRLEIISLQTLRTERVIMPRFNCQKVTWSPDGKRILYQDTESQLHILSINDGSEVSLPITATSLAGYDREPVWRTPDTVTFVVDRGGARWIDDLSLDDLKVRRRQVRDDEMNREFDRMFGIGRDHPYAWIYQGETYGLKNDPAVGFFATNLMVGNRDRSYAHRLLPGFYDGDPLYPSPDLRHLLVIQNGKARMLYLGVRPKPQLAFKIDLGLSAIGSESRADFDLFRKLKVPFRAEVFAPSANPLNGKQIGADFSHFKGRLEVVAWKRDHVILRPTLEIEPFGAGDVAANIRSDSESQHFGNRNFNFGDEWRVLEIANEQDTASNPIREQIAERLGTNSHQTVDATSADSDRAESAPAAAATTGSAPQQPKSAEFAGEHFPETRLRVLDSSDIEAWSESKLRYAINEIFARHGASFREKGVSDWFLQFAWYHPNSALTLDQVESSFSDMEKQNVRVLGEKRDAKSASRRSR